MPKAIKKKVRKKTAGTEHEVQDRLSDIKDLLRKKQRTVLTYSIAVVVIILAAAGAMFYKSTEDEKGRQLEYEAYKIYYNEYQKRPLSSQEQFQKALDLFKEAYNRKKAPRLLLYTANAFYELGRFDEALNSLNDLIKKHPEKDLVPLAYQKIASIHLKKGNRDEALKALDILYKSPGTIYKDFALIESGRILEAAGKKEEAAAKYKELTDKFKDSPFNEEARTKLGEKKEG